MATLVSQAADLGLIEPRAYPQIACFEAGVQFARTEGILPAPEANHAVRGVIDEALRCKEEGVSRALLVNLCGHGVGRFIHEEPSVPGIEDPRDRTVLWEGLVIAIEPFLSLSATHAVEANDGWTLRTNDGSLAAQFEHTVVVTKGKPIVVTASAAA